MRRSPRHLFVSSHSITFSFSANSIDSIMIIPVSAVLAAIVTIGTVSAANCWATVSDSDPYPSTLAIGKLEEMRQTICNNYWNLNVRLTTYAIPPSNWGTDWFASSGPYSGSYWGGEWTVLNLDSQSRCWVRAYSMTLWFCFQY